MADSKFKLSDPRFATVVLVVLAIVIVINVRTFFPSKSGSVSPVINSTSDLSTPGDLMETAAKASDFLNGQNRDDLQVIGASAGAGSGQWVASPFNKARKLTSTPSSTMEKPKPIPLEVSGVMIGGRRSLAWLDGESRSVGEVVRGYEILSISRDGVWVKKGKDKKFLAVQSKDSSDDGYHLVTQPENDQ